MGDEVEGQGIALAILREEPNAWPRFRESYEKRLLNLASTCLIGRQTGFGMAAEDSVQSFLLAKVFWRPEVMFGPCSRGEKPLWPRLARSYKNFFTGEARKRARERQPQARGGEALDWIPARVDRPDQIEQTNESLQDGLKNRLSVIRRTFADSAGGIPFCAVLLLSGRIQLNWQIGRCFQTGIGGLPNETDAPTLAAELMPWSPEELGQQLGSPSGPTLQMVWEELRPRLAVEPFRVDEGDVAVIIGVTRSGYYQWLSRAKKKVKERVEIEGCQALFPDWYSEEQEEKARRNRMESQE